MRVSVRPHGSAVQVSLIHLNVFVDTHALLQVRLQLTQHDPDTILLAYTHTGSTSTYGFYMFRSHPLWIDGTERYYGKTQ